MMSVTYQGTWRRRDEGILNLHGKSECWESGILVHVT